MVWYEAFGIAVAGAFVVYCFSYGRTRYESFIRNPRKNGRVLVFDMGVFFLGAGFVTLFLTQPTTTKEAFMSGCMWQGILGGGLAGKERRLLDQHVRHLGRQLETLQEQLQQDKEKLDSLKDRLARRHHLARRLIRVVRDLRRKEV